MKFVKSWKLILVILLLSLFKLPNCHAFSPFDLLMQKPAADEDELNGFLSGEAYMSDVDQGETYVFAEIIVVDKVLGKSSPIIKLDSNKNIYYRGMKLKLFKCWQSSVKEWEPDARAAIFVSLPADSSEASKVWLSSKFPGLDNFQNATFEILLQKCFAE